MKYLAIDSAAPNIGIILSVDGKIYAKKESNDRKASEILLSDVDELLDKAGLTLSDMDFFAVVTGPGSFTGIRIGVNTVKTFAYAVNKPVIAVTALEKAAYNKISKTTACIIKAYADFCFVSVYSKNREQVCKPECYTYAQAAEIVAKNGYSVIADEESAPHFKGAKKDDWKKSLTLAVEMKAAANELTSYDKIEPFYLLVSQAERELEKKQ